LIGALHRGDVTATVLSQPHREAVALRLGQRGWKLDQLVAQGRYLVFDADDAATQLIRNGHPHIDSIALVGRRPARSRDDHRRDCRRSLPPRQL
jgi:hypothetical protein